MVVPEVTARMQERLNEPRRYCPSSWRWKESHHDLGLIASTLVPTCSWAMPPEVDSDFLRHADGNVLPQ